MATVVSTGIFCKASARLLGATGLVLVLLGVSGVVSGGIFYTDDVPLYAVWQKSVTNSRGYSNPFDFNEVELQGSFTSPSGKETEFFGFYDGDGEGGQDGDVWRIRFMPTEVGTYQYSLSFSDGTGIDGNSGSFTVVESDLPGPPRLMGDNPPASYFLEDARGNPIKWKAYSISFGLAPHNNNDIPYAESWNHIKDLVDNHLLGQGYNATMIETRTTGAWIGGIPLINFPEKTFNLGIAKVDDQLLERLAENKVWTINWVAYVHQNEWDDLYNSYKQLLRYFVARNSAFYNYFGWSPTWETWEKSQDTERCDKYALYVNEISPWSKFPTVHDKAKKEWSDWQRIQLRQNQTHSVGGGNYHTQTGHSHWDEYKYIVIGAEDLWEQCNGKYGQPKNGEQVRHGVWGELLGGVYTMYSEWFHGPNIDGPCDGSANGEGDPFNAIAMNIWYDNTEWYTYTQKNGMVGKGICSGKDNTEYFVYNQSGGDNTIDLSSASGSYELTWFDPLTGDSESGGTLEGGTSVSLSPPGSMSSEWAALLVNEDAVDIETPVSQTRTQSPLVGFQGNDVFVSFPDGNVPTDITIHSLNGAVIFRGQIRPGSGRAQLTLPENLTGLHVVRLTGEETDYVVKLNVVP